MNIRKNRYKKQASEDKPKPEKKGFVVRIVQWFAWMSFFMMICAGLASYGIYYVYQNISKDLPRISSLKDYRPPIITTVYSDDNRKIAEFYNQRRIITPLSEIPKMLINAFVAAEDSRFFEHKGVDVVSIVRAFFKNMEAGRVVQGGSTITQQVTKYFLLTPEKSYERKLKEAILAYRIDKIFTKEEILFLYLNEIYLGHGSYGISAAAENYFGKKISELNLAECAMLAGLPQAPSRYSPFNYLDKAKERQTYVLNRMVIEGYISEAQAKEAINTPMDIKPRRNWYLEKVPYYTEYVRQYVEEKYGSDVLYNEGLQIYTAVNIEMQKSARKAIDKGLRSHDKRHGYRGPVRHIEPEKMEGALKNLWKELEDEEKTVHLHKGMVVKGVVTDVNKKDRSLTVCMGKENGIIANKDIKWAGRSRYNIRVGDLIWVKVKDKINNLSDDVEEEIPDLEEDDELLEIGEEDVLLSQKENVSDKSDQKEEEPPKPDFQPDEMIKWRLALEQEPEAQSALLCMELETGQIKAMVGGRDFRDSQFNRAIQSRRQPGSAFKPIIYAAALDKGFTPASELIDNAIIYTGRTYWKPRNYDRRFSGPILLRKALAKSRNTATVQILNKIGIGYAIEYAKKLGITSELGYNPSLSLGTSEVSLFEMINAYSIFANMGERAEPIFITKIVNRYGEVIEESHPEWKSVIEKNTAYIMTSLLESVVKEGTGRRVLALKRPDVAGKTGTTNDLRDAWFIGYTPGYIAGAWVGFDIEKSLGRGESGSKAAIPIWLDFMKQILADKPVRHFKVPPGVVFSKIDAENGLLAVPGTKKVLFECFKAGTVPKKYTRNPNAIADADQFFKSDM